MKKLIFLAVLAVGVTGCSVENDPSEALEEIKTANLSFEDVICGDAYGTNFSDLGSIMVFNDAENLTVRYLSHDPEGLVQARVSIVDSYEDFSVSGGGTLPPGQMQEKMNLGGEEYAQFTFPLSNFAGFEDNCLLIAPWAIFKENGGEHVAGDLPEDSSSPWYFEYCIQSCEPITPEPVIICETAFMEGNRPFLGKGDNILNLGNSRWGWANYYSGGDGTIVEELWAGAGKNDTSKATLVGYVTTSISGDNVNVQINMEDSYIDALNVTHIYFSSTAPTTTAPGQYGNSDENPEDGKTYEFTRSGAFWLIVHAEVCQEE